MKTSDIVWTCGFFDIVENELWFVPYERNLLCGYNIETKTVVDVLALDVSPFQVGSFDNVYWAEDKIFMIPAFENHLHVFDMKQRETRLVNIPEYTGAGGKFLLAHLYEEWIYLFPAFFDKIVKINMHTWKTEEVVTKAGDQCNAFCDMEVKGSRAYLVNRTSRIYMFNFETDELIVWNEFADTGELRTISAWNDKLLVTDQEGRMFVCDLATKKEGLFAEYGIAFIGTYCIDSVLFLIPLLEKDYFLRVNLEDQCLKKIELHKKEEYKKWPHLVFSRASAYKDCLYFFSTQYRTLVKYNYLTGELEESCLKIELSGMTGDTLYGWLRRETETGNSLVEGDGPYTTLHNFIEFCING